VALGRRLRTLRARFSGSWGRDGDGVAGIAWLVELGMLSPSRD
jgi:hypothetical protein